MSVIAEPFVCADWLVKIGGVGSSCKEQEEYYNNMIKSRIPGVEYANNSLIIGSGLGDSLWNEALNYEKNQEEINKQIIKEAEEKSVDYISNLEGENKKKNYLIYGGILVLVLGVFIYEFKRRK